MRVSYDPRTDTLTVIFREDVAVSESDEDKPGTILDYDGEGNLFFHPQITQIIQISEKETT